MFMLQDNQSSLKEMKKQLSELNKMQRETMQGTSDEIKTELS